ncbi:Histone-lysine N-methyltransferase ATXR2 [Linum perenne]
MDTIICPIDASCSEQVSALLQPPSPQQVQEYFDELLSTRQCHGLKVVEKGIHGKGVCANMDFEEGELVLRDQMLVGIQHSSNKVDCLVCGFCFRYIGSIELQIGRKLYLQSLGVSTSDECMNGTMSHDSRAHHGTNMADGRDVGGCSSKTTAARLPKELLESLMNGNLVLPHSDKFPLPSAVSCSGGCGEAYYCSMSCAEADWKSSHSLLCTGKRSESLSRDALLKFAQHANETNDIFLLAAKMIAFTILRYRKLKAGCLERKQPGSTSWELLLEAWKPISIGYKKTWWDSISLPADVSDETSFRMEVKELAFTSLQLLKEAIFDEECEPLFSLEIYGNIVGMFELNNLDLVVASPVEDYFLYIDDLPDPEKNQAERITQPLLDALGEEYSVCCEGTAFYPIQSCMNHSCRPNARAFKRDEDRDGVATILTAKAISKGEEITISYVEEDLPFAERRDSLADYGFNCTCDRCLQEEEEEEDDDDEQEDEEEEETL